MAAGVPSLVVPDGLSITPQPKNSSHYNGYVSRSSMDENNYMIRGLVLYQVKYYCVEATALSVLINHYVLRQRGSDVGCLGIDSTVFYVFTEDSTGSFFYKFSL